MAAGDLRFYRSSGSPADEVIAAVSGWAVHVDIELGDGSVLGELAGGLTRSPMPQLPAGRVVVYPTAQHTSADQLAQALNWAIEQLSSQVERAGYGWEDIADAGIHALDPAAPFIGQPGAYDCSDFATRFCLQAGLQLQNPALAAIEQEPHTVTPTMLAAALGVG